MRTACAILMAVSLGFATSTATAQSERAGAGERFARGLRLYDEGRDEAALAEFEEAYRIAPAWQVLYNIGRVHARLGRAVRAADVLERYLNEGGGAVPPERRAQVSRLLEEQRARIALVRVSTNAPRAVIMLDGVDLPDAVPGEPVRIAAGRHTIGARAEGYDTVQQELRLAGGVERVVSLELPRVAAQLGALRVASAIPEVAVFIDGEEVGRTPMDADIPVAPGEHVVEGRREGYLTAREVVQAREGQAVEATLRLEVHPDATRGELRLRLPEAAGTLFIDGARVASAGEPVSVVTGVHRLRVELAGRRPLDETIRVDASGLDYAPSLSWRDEERQARLDGSAAQGLAGWLLVGGGVAAVAGATVWAALGANLRQGLTDAEWDLFQGCYQHPLPVPVECADYTARVESAGVAAEADRELNVALAVGLGAIGLAATIVGLTLALTAPSESDIDAQASVQARLGLGQVSVEGSFR